MTLDNSDILVIHPGTLGDVLLALEAIRGLKKHFHSSRLVLVAKREIGSFLLECQEVDELLPLEGTFLSELFLTPDCWHTRTTEVIKKSTAVVCWMGLSNKSLVENLQSFKNLSVILQSPKEDTLRTTHLEDRFLESLQPWGVEPMVPRRHLRWCQPLDGYSSRKIYEKDSSMSENPTAVIHPGSGSLHKCSEPFLLRKVSEKLEQRYGMKLMIVGGPADELPVRNLIQELEQVEYLVLQDQDLLSIANFLSYAKLFIGHDSGLTHLAAALGIPTVVLFGPTRADQWAPRGDHVAVVRGNECHCSDWKQVQQCHPKPCLNIPIEYIFKKADSVFHQSNTIESEHLQSSMMSRVS